MSANFPAQFSSNRALQYGINLKKAISAELDEIISGLEQADRVQRVVEDMARDMSIINFGGGKYIMQLRKDFESTCASMQSQTHANVKAMTTMEWYTFYNILKERNSKR